MHSLKNIFIIAILTIIVFISTHVVRAEGNDYESILSYHSDISVNKDNSIHVVETIVYDTGLDSRHGIYRDIFPFSSQDRKMNIRHINVTDENNIRYRYEILNEGEHIRIKIGDPDVVFSGQKTYVISYDATKAVGQFKDVDEIYWNVTGNGWDMPIYDVSATIILPENVTSKQSACYYGPQGSTDRCSVETLSEHVFIASVPTALSPYEGLTIAVGFEKGFVSPYTTADNVLAFFQRYASHLIGLLIFALTSFFSIRYWYKKGRDPKGTGVIVPQYAVLDGLTPLETVGLAKESISSKDISAEIIYLATKGYIQIREIQEKTLGIFSSTDYVLILLKSYEDLPNEFDREIIHRMFKYKSSQDLYCMKDGNVLEVDPLHPEILNDKSVTVLDSVKFSSLKYLFSSEINDIVKLAFSGLQAKEYYKNITGLSGKNGLTIFLVFFSVWTSGFVGGFIGLFLKVNAFPIMIGIFLSFIVVAIVMRLAPAKTEKGVEATEYILGLKEYLEIAEKDRLMFHNAPERKPEIFEALLPYAMALGVADIWAKEFEGIYMTPPNWYVGAYGSHFSTSTFTHSLGTFSTVTSSHMSASRGGGSGGGGSSVGGGGGRGGGSW